MKRMFSRIQAGINSIQYIFTGVSPFASSYRRLVLLIMAVSAVILLSMSVAIYITNAAAIDQQINSQLIDLARSENPASLFSTIQIPGQSRPDSDETSPFEHYIPTSPNVFSIVLDNQGKVIYDPGNAQRYGLPDISGVNAILQGKVRSLLQTHGHNDHDFRLYTVPVIHDGVQLGVLQVGISLHQSDEQLHTLLMTLVLVGLGVLFIIGLISFALARRILLPVQAAYERQHRFTAAASHELRTPLAIMRSELEYIDRRLHRSEMPPASTLSNDLNEVIDEVDYMTRMIGDLLVLARDAHEPANRLHESIDLNSLIEAVIAKVQRTDDQHIYQTMFAKQQNYPGETALQPTIDGDPDRIRQLLIILLDNARQYTPSSGKIRIETRIETNTHVFGAATNQALIIVEDTGVGISSADLSHIFDPFYRADPGRTQQETTPHTGLGLAIASWIIEAHGGAISVHSSTAGEAAPHVSSGTSFTIAFPLKSIQELDSNY